MTGSQSLTQQGLSCFCPDASSYTDPLHHLRYTPGMAAIPQQVPLQAYSTHRLYADRSVRVHPWTTALSLRQAARFFLSIGDTALICQLLHALFSKIFTPLWSISQIKGPSRDLMISLFFIFKISVLSEASHRTRAIKSQFVLAQIQVTLSIPVRTGTICFISDTGLFMMIFSWYSNGWS